MKRHVLGLCFSSIALALTAACGGGSGYDVYCSITSGGTTGCTAYTNLTSDEQSSVEQACTTSEEIGKLLSSCPTSGVVGCCNVAASSNGAVAYETCDYSPLTTSDAEGACAALGGTFSTSM